MGSGSYIICEWNAVQEYFPNFQRVLADLESQIIAKANADWAPKTLGYLKASGDQYGRTTILPSIFRGNDGNILSHWRQYISSTGHQLVLYGINAGHTIPEDFKVAWVGLAFPNKNQQIKEIKFQIGDRKYGRINLEEIESYNVPAVVFEEGIVINEEESFDLYAYVDEADYQRIVMLGALYFKVKDKVLGDCGSAIT